MRLVRLLTTLCAALACGLLAAAPALAGNDNGQGWYGETDDKVVTYSAFFLLIAIPLLIVVLNAAQRFLEKRRKERGG